MSLSELWSPFKTSSPLPEDLDLSTYANYRDVRTKHLDLDWTIDWDARLIHGQVTLTMEVTAASVDAILLDDSLLDIKNVSVDGEEVKYSLGERRGVCGSELKVPLVKELKKGDSVKVIILYSTTKECTAVGWLDPVQTKSGKYPYLYTQCQAIHARSLVPCQDTPAVKATYSAKVKSTFPVLMSGLRKSPPSDQPFEVGKEVEYVYDQPIAAPSYLIAIAAGELAYRKCDDLPGREWKSGVWTEPLMLDAAFEEFGDAIPKFVSTAEDLTSKYVWGVYDMLFLPESFPFGGMENCCLTFATPTVIAGDKSAVDLAAHEIGHSWFGNGIGCASWAHFWLNEGWTTYFERLLIREMHGEAERQLSYVLGRRGMMQDLKLFEPRFQRLVVGLKEYEDPDDSYSRVAYDKGANLLLYLERALGGLDHFLPYMKDYVKTFSGVSITTSQWKAHLFDYFGKQPNANEYMRRLGQVDFDEWLYGSGLDLCVNVEYDDSLSKPCEDLAIKWDQSRKKQSPSFSMKDIESFSTNQRVAFLDKLEAFPAMPPSHVKLLDKTYGFGSNDNAEIALRFFQVALKAGPEYVDQAAVSLGHQQGQDEVLSTHLPTEAPDVATKTFGDHKDFYHPIARKMIAKDIGYEL